MREDSQATPRSRRIDSSDRHANLSTVTDEAQDGFVEDGPERAKGHKTRILDLHLVVDLGPPSTLP